MTRLARGNSDTAMNASEWRAASGLAAIFGLRMLGLFLILPVFALYGDALAGATPTLIGLAIGVYGLTQALLQIPLGSLSDRIGRRPVILGGLLVFVMGSVIAAMAESIHAVILGRILQGAGAVAAAILALAADLSRERQRSKVMAVIGISVGAAFMLALVAGPIIAGAFGLGGVFWTTAALALVATGLLYVVVPRGGQAGPRPETSVRRDALKRVLTDPDLLRLDAGIFTLHLVMTASFVVFPVVLRDALGLASADHWQVYIPVLLASVLVMGPVLGLGERRRIMHRLLGVVVLALAVADTALAIFLSTPPVVLFALWLFFAAFNILEASLPSLVSRFAPGDARGTALGIYSTAQFAGAFVGGLAGGWLYGVAGVSGVFGACAGLGAVWFVIALGLRAPAGDRSDIESAGSPL